MNALKHDCDSLIQEIAAKKHPICQMPLCGKPMSAGHHLFGRKNQATRFNPQAVLSLCLTHHAYAHSHPVSFRGIVKELLVDDFDALEAMSGMTVQFRDADYKRIKEALTALAKEVQCTR
jgi:hypothetical protein